MEELIARMNEHPWVFESFREYPTDPTELINVLTGAGDRAFISRDELHEIARVKSPRRANDILLNDLEFVILHSAAAVEAINAPDPNIPIDHLREIDGVGIGVATAALAWCFPTSWAVLDEHSWRTLRCFGLTQRSETLAFRDRDVDWYILNVRNLAANLPGRTPQNIDRWLFGFSKIFLGPLDGNLRVPAL